MYESNIKANQLIEDLKSEVDIYSEIPDSAYIEWLDSLEQMLYSEIIKEQKSLSFDVSSVTNNTSKKSFSVNLDNSILNDLKDVDDICAIYAEDWESNENVDVCKKRYPLVKSTMLGGIIFPDTWYKTIDNNFFINLSEEHTRLLIVYFVRPNLKADNDAETIKLPPEFIPLVKAKLRGEAYKLVNEDEYAAKWLNDYNVLLENFKTWINNRAPQFGQ